MIIEFRGDQGAIQIPAGQFTTMARAARAHSTIAGKYLRALALVITCLPALRAALFYRLQDVCDDFRSGLYPLIALAVNANRHGIGFLLPAAHNEHGVDFLGLGLAAQATGHYSSPGACARRKPTENR